MNESAISAHAARANGSAPRSAGGRAPPAAYAGGALASGQSRLRSDEARRALDESIERLTNEQEAVRNTKSAAGAGGGALIQC